MFSSCIISSTTHPNREYCALLTRLEISIKYNTKIVLCIVVSESMGNCMLTGNNEKPDAQWPQRLHGQEWQLL